MLPKIVFSSAIALVGAVLAEPVCWSDGTWDDSGAPEGVLLSDNEGWWGRCVFTGVTYSYETDPTSPRDALGGKKEFFGRRLLDGDSPNGWHRPVGITAKRPLVVVFDFKRSCRFSEVDLISEKTKSASALIEVSADGSDWKSFADVKFHSPRTRVRPGEKIRGRYLRLTFKAGSSSATYLDEVLVWGEGEVSADFPERIVPVDSGGALKMAGAEGGGIRIFPLKDPVAGSPVKTGMPPMSFEEDRSSPREVVMARDETEVRYYAVANGTGHPVRLPFSVSGFGEGAKAELRIGGLVRTRPPKRKLTEKQRFDLQLTGAEPEGAFDSGGMDVLPFFSADTLPPENFARKYLANPEQVSHFPSEVEIAPGEGAVVMLRITTDGAAPGVRKGSVVAGDCRFDVPLRILDANIHDAPAPWIFVWGQFTRQFPFESLSRMRNDVHPLLELGATMVPGLPEKGSKTEIFALGRGLTNTYYRVFGVERKLVDKTYKGGTAVLTDEDRRSIESRIAAIRSSAAACGVGAERVVLEISDEPGMRNAAIFGDVCRHIRSVAPEMLIYMNPCFWTGKGFTPAEDIVSALGGYYNRYVDVSVPYRSLVEDEKARNALWASPRAVNAQYAHPAHRAGRSIAWSSFRYGLGGFGYWAYYSPKGNPWDVRTWKYWSYECQLAFPLENGVALTPVYEEMREAYEDWLLLSLLRKKGRLDELDALLGEFAASFDRANMETARPYRCDFAALRLRALNAVATRP